MSGMRAFRLVLAVVIAVLVLRAAPAHATHSVPVIALEIDRRTPTTLYAGTDGGGGVFKSTDGGDSWSVSGLAYIDALVIDPLTPTTLHAGIDSWGTYKSTDGAVGLRLMRYTTNVERLASPSRSRSWSRRIRSSSNE